MKLREILEFFVKEGVKEDLRSARQTKAFLKQKADAFRKARGLSKKFFDKNTLSNPYADTRILTGDPNKEIKRVLVGIDIEVGEILMADRLNIKGAGIDLVIAHHPEGVALAGLDDCMHLQADVLKNLGVENSVADDLMKQRISEVNRRLHSANHTRTVDAARLLGIPLMCVHTPADNHVSGFLQRLVDTKKPKTLQEIVNLLMRKPEYVIAAQEKAGPQILIGKPEDKAGKIFVDMTGGTEGSKEIFARLSQLGIKTILGMHFSEEHYKKMKTEYVNVVNAGHIASDNLGMNLLLDKLEKKSNIEVIECSGFKRVRHPWG